MNIRQLRKLVLETIQEEKRSPRKTRSAKSRSRKLTKILREADEILQEEEKEESDASKADPDKLDHDEFPLKLSDVAADSKKAEELVKTGDGDPDSIVVKADDWSAAELKPSQTSMNLGKAIWFALGMENGTMWSDSGDGGPGGKTGAFISDDNFLMDGHHRWIATVMADPSAVIEGFRVMWPAKETIAVLNTVTVGLLGIEKGKPGTGGFDQFKDAPKVLSEIQKFAEGTHEIQTSKNQQIAGTDKNTTALEVMESATGKEGDEAVKAIAEKYFKNVSDNPNAKDPPSEFPERKDMPVIDDKHAAKYGAPRTTAPAVKATMQKLNVGQVDVNENRIVKRWNKLAGLLKD
tara:strand:+ start:2777 stop:3826 length:1050 start_codon:yes stop_codon:yes gene_type:complete